MLLVGYWLMVVLGVLGIVALIMVLLTAAARFDDWVRQTRLGRWIERNDLDQSILVAWLTVSIMGTVVLGIVLLPALWLGPSKGADTMPDERVVLSDWERYNERAIHCTADGPGGKYRLVLFLDEHDGAAVVPGAWLGGAGAVLSMGFHLQAGSGMGDSVPAAKEAYLPLLVAMASVPTPEETRVLDSVLAMDIDDVGIVCCATEDGTTDEFMEAWEAWLKERGEYVEH